MDSQVILQILSSIPTDRYVEYTEIKANSNDLGLLVQAGLIEVEGKGNVFSFKRTVKGIDWIENYKVQNQGTKMGIRLDWMTLVLIVLTLAGLAWGIFR